MDGVKKTLPESPMGGPGASVQTPQRGTGSGFASGHKGGYATPPHHGPGVTAAS